MAKSTAPPRDAVERARPGAAERSMVARNIAATSDDRAHSGEFAPSVLTAPPAEPVPLTEADALDAPAMGSCPAPVDRATIVAHLSSIGDVPLADDARAPCSFLAKMHAELMRTNVTRGSSIHVSTRARHFQAVGLGQPLTVRGRIDRRLGRRDGRDDVLETAWVEGDDRVVAQAGHPGVHHLRW